jgi:hypothetical protein
MPPDIPADKANHYTYGAAISIVAFAAALLMGLGAAVASQLAVCVTASAGVGKEAHDAWINRRTTGEWRRGPHIVDPFDAVWTAAGALPLAVGVHLPEVLRRLST